MPISMILDHEACISDAGLFSVGPTDGQADSRSWINKAGSSSSSSSPVSFFSPLLFFWRPSPLWHNRWQGFPCLRLSNNTTLYSHVSHIISHPMVSVAGLGRDGLLHTLDMYIIQVPSIAREIVKLPCK